jgi:hypothetical protein
MFLAAIYPMSEKSALNLPGKINGNNVTYYESEEVYLTHMTSAIVPDVEEEKEEGGGGQHAHGRATKKKQQQQQSSHPIGAEPMDGIEEEAVYNRTEPTIPYEMYQAFWRLQHRFSSDLKNVQEMPEQWAEFMVDARKVITLLSMKEYSYSDEELRRAKALLAATANQLAHSERGTGNRKGTAPAAAAAETVTSSKRKKQSNVAASAAATGDNDAAFAVGSVTAGSEAYSSCKYLTSSQVQYSARCFCY